MNINGANIILECLKRLGVTDIFGYPGGSILPLYDALYDYSDIKHYLVRHERGAASAADSYARTTGKPGICLATSGPGATNLISGILTAYNDSVPLIAITGQLPMNLIGKNNFQDCDICHLTSSITKKNYFISDIRTIPYILKEAFWLSTNESPGPLLIDIPKNIQLESIPLEEFEQLWNLSFKYSFFRELNSLIDNDSLIISDLNQELTSIANKCGLKLESKRAGYAIPAAIGAQIGNPTKKIYAFMGENGFQMNQQELILLKQYSLPIKIIILPYGEENKKPNFSISPDFSLLADAFDIKLLEVNDFKSLSLIKNFLYDNKPFMVKLNIYNNL